MAIDNEFRPQYFDFLPSRPLSIFGSGLDLYTPKACQCEAFSTAYVLRKTTQGTRFFVPQNGVEKIIINMVDNDHGMRDTVYHGQPNQRMIMGTFWFSGTWAPPRGGALSTADIEAKLRKLTSIDYVRHN